MTVAEQTAAPSIPEPDLPTEFRLNPEKAAALKIPVQQTTEHEAAPLTPDYENIVAPKQKYAPAPVEEEYVLISNSAPEFINEAAMRVPEDSGPPSEALSVILGRAAVAEHLKHLEDTLGVRVTPVPIPVSPQNKHRKKRSLMEPEAVPTETERPVMQHATEKNPNQLVATLSIIIGVLALVILTLLFLKM